MSVGAQPLPTVMALEDESPSTLDVGD